VAESHAGQVTAAGAAGQNESCPDTGGGVAITKTAIRPRRNPDRLVRTQNYPNLLTLSPQHEGNLSRRESLSALNGWRF